MDFQTVWEQAVAFHGCECPALAIGARATAYVIETLGLTQESARQVVCTAESFSCAIDAIQGVLGCTIGNGRLRVLSNRKLAFRFCDGATGRSLYLSLRTWQQARPGLTTKLLEMPMKDLFVIESLNEVPSKAPNCVLSSACPIRNPEQPEKQRRTAYPRGYDRDW